jgi:hypothetical protein
MIVLRHETHTHSKTYRFNELTELTKSDNFGDKMFRIKQLMILYEQQIYSEADQPPPSKRQKASKAKAAKKKKNKSFSSTKFVTWLGNHWQMVSNIPGVKECGVTHFFVKWLALSICCLCF